MARLSAGQQQHAPDLRPVEEWVHGHDEAPAGREGGISEYQTKAGPRFLIKYPVLQEDGTKRVVLKRGYKTRRDTASALRAEIRRMETGEWVNPSKQPLGAYLAE